MKPDKFEILTQIILVKFENSRIDQMISIADLNRFMVLTITIYKNWIPELDLVKNVKRYVHK